MRHPGSSSEAIQQAARGSSPPPVVRADDVNVFSTPVSAGEIQDAEKRHPRRGIEHPPSRLLEMHGNDRIEDEGYKPHRPRPTDPPAPGQLHCRGDRDRAGDPPEKLSRALLGCVPTAWREPFPDRLGPLSEHFEERPYPPPGSRSVSALTSPLTPRQVASNHW